MATVGDAGLQDPIHPPDVLCLAAGDARERVVRELLARPARAGSCRVLAVDGRSGSGKSSFASLVARALGDVPVLRLDQVYPGWDGLDAGVQRMAHQLLRPLAAGDTGRWPTYDWTTQQDGPVLAVAPSPLLIVEGCGVGARSAAPYLSLLVWLECPALLRRRRAICRDGEQLARQWSRWARQEDAHEAREGTRARADLRLVTQRWGTSS
ncbi:MAG: uridine kinase family protein [Angustibacter sp.]